MSSGLALKSDDRSQSVGIVLGGTSQTLIYEVPAGVQVKVAAVLLANVSGSDDVQATIEWMDDSASATYCLFKGPVESLSGNAVIDLAGLALEVGDQILVTADSADKLHAVMVYVETFGRSR